MLNIQGTYRIQKLSGRKADGSVEEIPGLLCPRKHMIDSKEWARLRRSKVFAFVSSPKIYKQKKMLDIVQAWCHPFRRPYKVLPEGVPSILLPESNFLDSSIVKNRAPRKIQYDYFYFTVNSEAGVKFKGLPLFFELLPQLKHLRGLIIVYYPNSGKPEKFRVAMTPQHRKNLKAYDHSLKYHWGLLSADKMDTYMKMCRFGFFPNKVDNSPRILAESLIRDVPVLVNEKIHGGWHYINNETGKLFNKENFRDSLEFMMDSSFSPRSYFESNYGFTSSSQKLADFLNPIFGYNYTHIYFRSFSARLGKIKHESVDINS